MGGYTFTGSDFITPNLYEVHHDPRNFTDPFSFNPERFIDETSGKFREAIQRTCVVKLLDIIASPCWTIYPVQPGTFCESSFELKFLRGLTRR